MQWGVWARRVSYFPSQSVHMELYGLFPSSALAEDDAIRMLGKPSKRKEVKLKEGRPAVVLYWHTTSSSTSIVILPFFHWRKGN